MDTLKHEITIKLKLDVDDHDPEIDTDLLETDLLEQLESGDMPLTELIDLCEPEDYTIEIHITRGGPTLTDRIDKHFEENNPNTICGALVTHNGFTQTCGFTRESNIHNKARMLPTYHEFIPYEAKED